MAIVNNAAVNICVHVFPGGSDSKESTCKMGDLGSILKLGRSPGEVNGTCSSILAWRISWTEDPGELQSKSLT